MRKTVKRTKVQLINKMVKRVRVLNNCTRGTEQSIAKKKRKAERILKEIEVIKRLNPDKVSKYALACTCTVDDVANLPSASETKAMARYSNHKVLQEAVQKFREKHADWKALAAYLLSKNTGRRYKKKATKEKITANVASTNKKADETLMQNFLQQKGAVECDSVIKPKDTLRQKNKEKRTRKDSGDELSISELKKSVETFDESPQELNTEEKLPDKVVANSDSKGVPLVMECQSSTSAGRKHMVIQAFSLSDATEDALPVYGESNHSRDIGEQGVPEFLQKADEIPTAKPARARRDAFFMGGDEDVDSGTESIDVAGSDDDGSDLEDNSDQLLKGKLAMRSTFVGSLTDDRKEKMSSWAQKHLTVRRPMSGGKTDFHNRKRKGDESFYGHKPARQHSNQRQNYGSNVKSYQAKVTHGQGRGNAASKSTSNNAKASTVQEKLHPSWEASKLRKQQKSIQTFQGKKTTFADDD